MIRVLHLGLDDLIGLAKHKKCEDIRIEDFPADVINECFNCDEVVFHVKSFCRHLKYRKP